MTRDHFLPEDGHFSLRHMMDVALQTYRKSKSEFKARPDTVSRSFWKRYIATTPKDPVFIIGSSRSGTTFFGTCLSQSLTDISYHLEPYASVAMNPPLSHGNWNKRFARFIIRQYVSWLQRVHGQGGKTYIEKNPMNALAVPYYIEAFPCARFIHLIRDGRDAALSISKRWPPNFYYLKGREKELYARMPLLEGSAKIWQKLVLAAREHCAHLPEDQYLEVRYEDLMEKPEDAAKKITDFLDIKDDEASSHLASLFKAGQKEQIGKWKSEISKEDQNVFETEIAETLIALGYK